MRSRRWSAVGLIAAAVACVTLNARVTEPAIQIATAILLVLFLPGTALVLMVDPGYRHVKGSERLLWCSLGSIAVAISGGLILNVASALTRTIWLAYLLGVVVVAAIASMLRRGPPDGPKQSWATHLSGMKVSVSSALFGIGAVSLLVGALVVSVYSSATANRERFMQLWILPIPRSAGSTAVRAEVGVTNYEGHRVRIEVSINAPGTILLSHRQVVLREGQTWTYYLTRKKLVPVIATVAFASRPSRTLDSVKLASPVR